MINKNKLFVAIVLVLIGITLYAFAFLNKDFSFLLHRYIGSNNLIIEGVDIQTEKCRASSNTTITKVIDGDTVIVEGGYSVRLSGIDADEKGHQCYDEAKYRLEKLVLHKNIMLEKEKIELDKYKRCLATVFIENENINLKLVKEGLVVAKFYGSELKYENEIIAAEKYASENNVGCKWEK